MKIERIAYEQLYPTGVYANIRLRAEATILAHEDATECYKMLRDEVEKAFTAMNPQIDWLSDSATTESSQKENLLPPKESIIQSHIKTINECNTLNNLKIFEKLVAKTADPQLTNAYTIRHEQLWKQNQKSK